MPTTVSHPLAGGRVTVQAIAHATQDATGAWNVRSLKDATLARKERGFAHRVAVVGVRWDGQRVDLLA